MMDVEHVAVEWCVRVDEQIAELKRRDALNERRLNEFRKEFYRLQSAVAKMKEGKR